MLRNLNNLRFKQFHFNILAMHKLKNAYLKDYLYIKVIIIDLVCL